MNKELVQVTMKAFASWLLIAALASAIMALNSPFLGFVIACAFMSAAAKLQEKFLFG